MDTGLHNIPVYLSLFTQAKMDSTHLFYKQGNFLLLLARLYVMLLQCGKYKILGSNIPEQLNNLVLNRSYGSFELSQIVDTLAVIYFLNKR